MDDSHPTSATLSTTPPLLDYAAQRFQMLCLASGLAGGDTARSVATFKALLSSAIPARAPLSWISEISDDNTPIEFSVAIANDEAEVRVLFEPQGKEATLAAYRAAGLALHDRLEHEFGADLQRFRQVQALFLPKDMAGPFAVWSSAVFAANLEPSFKTYFNAQAQGAKDAHSLVREGLSRLRLDDAWSVLSATVLRRGPYLDEVKYFALDLTSSPEARVKLYVRHHDATSEDLEIAASGAASYLPGEAHHFVSAMSGKRKRLDARAAFTCSSFAGGRHDRPTATTLYVPVCAYANNDHAVSRRIHDYLVGQGSDSRLYDRIIAGFANRPLDRGVGMQSWVAIRRHAGHARLTVYLAIEAIRVHPPGIVPAPTFRCADWPGTAAVKSSSSERPQRNA